MFESLYMLPSTVSGIYYLLDNYSLFLKLFIFYTY